MQPSATRPYRLAYLVSHPIQYQAPLLRRISADARIDLTVLFGSDFSVRDYKDEGFGVNIAWDVPLLEGYRSEFLPALRDTGKLSVASPLSRNLYSRLKQGTTSGPFEALWLHGYASLNALQGILAARALRIPVLLRAESWLADRPRSPLTLAAKSLFFRVLEPYVGAVLPIGTANADYWRHYFGERVPQFAMPYAVDNARFAAAAASAETAELRTQLALAPGRPVILFAAKLQPRKHADHLLEAFAALLRQPSLDPLPYLVVVGEGEERAALEARSAALGLQQDVRFPGFRNQSELPAYFALAAVFVLPSQHEPWGLVVNEALAAGCPVIVSNDVGCHADLVREADPAGLVFPAGDVAALTAALRNILTNPALAQQMSSAARRRMATWSFEEDVHGLLAALEHITQRKALS